jgi:hypothetical protein
LESFPAVSKKDAHLAYSPVSLIQIVDGFKPYHQAQTRSERPTLGRFEKKNNTVAPWPSDHNLEKAIVDRRLHEHVVVLFGFKKKTKLVLS